MELTAKQVIVDIQACFIIEHPPALELEERRYRPNYDRAVAVETFQIGNTENDEARSDHIEDIRDFLQDGVGADQQPVESTATIVRTGKAVEEELLQSLRALPQRELQQVAEVIDVVGLDGYRMRTIPGGNRRQLRPELHHLMQ